MFHYLNVITDDNGNALPGWQVEVVQLSDGETVVPIFSDENSTPIVTVSGVANRAVADAAGNYDFFVPNGTYSLRFYDDQGGFQKTLRYLPMYGSPDPISTRLVTGTTDTLLLSDAFGAVDFDNASAITLTVPPEADVGFLNGTFIELRQLGAGAVTIQGGTGVTINSRGSLVTTFGQFAMAGLRKDDNLGANHWILAGDLT